MSADPYAMDSGDLRRLLYQASAGFTATDPKAQAKLPPMPLALRSYYGVEVVVSDLLPEGDWYILKGTGVGVSTRMRIMMAPLTAWRFRHGGRDPLLSRWCAGVREVRRYRRRRGCR